MKRFLGSFVLAYLRLLAKLSLLIHKPKLIGITGSVGKTSARNAIYAVLKDHFPTKMIEKGNSETGIPLGILGLSPRNYSYMDWLRLLIQAPFGLGHLMGTKYLVIEMGIDEPVAPKNMGYLLTIVKPEISVLINVHPVHTMQFQQHFNRKDLDFILNAIASEKGKIFTANDNCKFAVLNSDNKYVVSQAEKIKHAKSFTFGTKKDSDCIYGKYDVSLRGTAFEFLVGDDKITLKYKNYVLPYEYFEAFSSAILVGKILGLNKIQIQNSLLHNVYMPRGRATLFEGIHESKIIDSSYNASRASVLAFLHLVSKLKKETKRPVAFIFGDMRELGENAREEHEKVAEEVIKEVDYLYCVGPLTKSNVIPYLKDKKKFKELEWFENSLAAGEYLKENLPEGAIVLVKGSQNTIFLEEAVKKILKNKNDIRRLCRQSDYWMKIKS